jgi:hypothetical protein
MATEFKVTISLLDLLQISPDFARQLHKLSTRVNEKKKCCEPAQSSHLVYLTVPSQSVSPTAAVLSLSANILPECHKSGYPMIISTLASDKAWQIPVVSKIKYNRVVSDISLSSTTCITDQGSDINVVTQALVDLLHLKTYLVSDSKSDLLGMATSDSSITALCHFAIL